MSHNVQRTLAETTRRERAYLRGLAAPMGLKFEPKGHAGPGDGAVGCSLAMVDDGVRLNIVYGEGGTRLMLVFDAATRTYRVRLEPGTKAQEVLLAIKRRMGLSKAEIDGGMDRAAGRAFVADIFRLALNAKGRILVPKRVRPSKRRNKSDSKANGLRTTTAAE